MIKRLSMLCNFHQSTVPFHNIAVEEYLLHHIEADECCLFLWQNRQTVVIGRNQNAWRECRVAQLEADGGYLARRLSGGGAVYHDLGNLNFTFLVRAENYDVARQLRVILQAVQSFGVHAQQTGRNDITINGCKFSGNAFYRTGDRCYHHGTLVISVNMDALSRYLQVSQAKLQSNGVKSVHSRVANLTQFIPGLTVDAMAMRLRQSFSEVYQLPVNDLTEGMIPQAELAAREAFFSSWEWRLGAPLTCSVEIGQRFSWGDLHFRITLKDGRVARAAVDSDGLEADYIASLPKFLEGCRYDRNSLLERLGTLPARTAAQQQILQSAAQLLQRDLE